MALTGDVKALIQVNNGHVLAGTNNAARVYRSSDNGQTWTQIHSFGASGSVNAFAKENSGPNVYAAVTGTATVQGVWKSVDYGASWTRVKSHPNNVGYWDITSIQGTGRLVAVTSGITDVNTSSPIIYSGNSGTTWTNVSTPHFGHPFTSVASYPEPVLFTVYPGEGAYSSVFTFMGTDTYYTGAYGVGVPGGNPSFFSFGSVGGGIGNGGLDMAVFLYYGGDGRVYRKALWAVKSALNTANTEIWQWPVSPTGSYQFAKIATIANENFCTLYVDPPPNTASQGIVIPSQRTIWAGAAGKIYVSYNSGLTWAIATEVPVGTICAFVRTTSGELIAGGTAGEIFLFSGTGGEGGGEDPDEEPPPDPEEPGDDGLVTSRFLGRTATCENEVFVSNKSSFSNITHVFHYNGTTFSSLQFGTTPPYSLVGSPTAVNKAVYFGSKTNDANVPGGTFSSLVFDITQKNENLTIEWKYWTGVWTTLVVQDNTDQFKNLGVNSVSWEVPTNWVTTTFNGVTGYWVRAVVTAVGANPVVPIQDNRFIYTTLLPYVEIAAGDVKGDLPAVGRTQWYNQSNIAVERVLCGLRSVDRGANFSPYINISDVQLPFGLTITKGTEAGVNWANDITAPTGRVLTASYSSASDLNDWNDLVTITLSTTVAREYHGYYRALLRVFYNNASANAWNLRVQMRFGSGGTRLNTVSVYPGPIRDWETLDFRQLAISTREIANQSGSLSDQMQIVVQGYCTTVSKPLTLYDLILIPIDEWAIDAMITDLTPVGTPEIVTHNYMDIDSITNPKIAISALNRNAAGLIVSKYQNINNGPMILQKNKDQRLWFLSLSYENSYWRGYPETVGSVQVYKQQQYLGYRGVN